MSAATFTERFRERRTTLQFIFPTRETWNLLRGNYFLYVTTGLIVLFVLLIQFMDSLPKEVQNWLAMLSKRQVVAAGLGLVLIEDVWLIGTAWRRFLTIRNRWMKVTAVCTEWQCGRDPETATSNQRESWRLQAVFELLLPTGPRAVEYAWGFLFQTQEKAEAELNERVGPYRNIARFW